MLEQILLSLVGGLMGAIIGALVGGYLSYKGALDASKQQIDYLYSQEKEKRNYEEQQQAKVLKQALKVEAQENLDVARNWEFFDNRTFLTTEAWATYKAYINTLPPILQERLILAYAEIKRYNSLLESDRGRNLMHDAIKYQVKQVVEICLLLIDELSES